MQLKSGGCEAGFYPRPPRRMHQLALALAPLPPTLANFVPGRNGEALAAVADLAGNAPRERFVYLWGEPGSGRTHLARAAVQAAIENGLRASLVDASALGAVTPSTEALVAVDDANTLPEAAQVALFDLHNQLRAGTGRLLVTGDHAPRNLNVREDLRTRLAAGLAFELHPPSDAERAEALKAHAARRGLTLDDAVVDYLLARAARDMLTLVAVIDALDRASLERSRAVTVPLVREVLAGKKETQ